MIDTSSQHARFRFLKLSATVIAAVLVLAGCSVPFDMSLSDPDAPNSFQPDSSENNAEKDDAGDDADAVTPGQHHVTLTMTGQSFTFAPTTCVNEDDDLRISGPGVDDGDKAPVFLDMDIGRVDGWPAGKVFVYFNAKQAAPTDVYFEAEVGSGDDYSMGHVLNGFEAEVFFRNHDAVPTGDGTFMIICG